MPGREVVLDEELEELELEELEETPVLSVTVE